MTGTDHWKRSVLPVAKRRPPWCPTPDDGAFLLDAAREPLVASKDPSVLVLGVTPETVQLAWPDGIRYCAVDYSTTIIESLWQPNPRFQCEIHCADWKEMPVGDDCADMVAGDGSLNALATFDDAPAVLAEVARVLRPGGAFALRCFVRRIGGPTPEEVVDAAFAGRYPTTAAFRLAFVSSLPGAERSLRFGDIFETYDRLVPDRRKLAEATGWPAFDISLAETDKDNDMRFSFPTIDQFLGVFEPRFAVRSIRYGDYVMSSHCPTFVLSAKA